MTGTAYQINSKHENARVEIMANNIWGKLVVVKQFLKKRFFQTFKPKHFLGCIGV